MIVPTELTLPIALLAGLLSFISPCILPLVPGYLAFVSGAAAAGDSTSTSDREHVAIGTVLFVLGFTVVFVALGSVAAAFGGLFDAQRVWMSRLAGAVMIVMGGIVLGIVRYSGVWREWKPLHLDKPAGLLGALGLGAAFGLGWTPCIGPALASILALAGTAGHLEDGALLLFAYSLGLGLPFIASSLILTRLSGPLQALRRVAPAVNTVSGTAMIGLGLLFLSNQSFYISVAGQRLLALAGR